MNFCLDCGEPTRGHCSYRCLPCHKEHQATRHKPVIPITRGTHTKPLYGAYRGAIGRYGPEGTKADVATYRPRGTTYEVRRRIELEALRASAL